MVYGLLKRKDGLILEGLSGFNKKQDLFLLHQRCEYCQVKGCVTGIHWLSEPMPIMSNGKPYILYGMRHDQIILSILRIRHRIPTVLKHGSFMNLEV